MSQSHTKSLLLFFATLFFSLSSLVYSDLQVKRPPPPPLPVVVKPPSPPVKPPQPPVIPWIRTVKDCRPLCEFRCSSHSRPNVCIRACTACCFRCKCVPPGTHGNREKCGKCYVSMTTHGKRPKCP